MDKKELNNLNAIGRRIVEESNPITPPKPFNNNDSSTYPSNQIKNINTWNLLVDQAIKNPKDENSIQVQKMIKKDYFDHKKRKKLTDNELKAIGKHNSQLKPIPQSEIQKFPVNYKPFVAEPSQSFEEFVAERRKKQYGLSEQLVSDKIAVAKMTDWVLGKTEERTEESIESENENINNKEKKGDR